MSAIAEFINLDASKVEELKEAAKIKKSWFGKKIDYFHSFIETHANKRQHFNGYGYLYGTLLIYLAEAKGIDLINLFPKPAFLNFCRFLQFFNFGSI